MRVVELNLEALDLKYARLSVRQPAAERRLLASLGESGQQSPVIVVAATEPGRYVVVDGHKRVRALGRLKADVAKAAVWEMTEAEGLAMAYQMGAQGKRDAFEEGWLVAELHRAWRWSLGEVAQRLVRSKSWVSKRLALVEELPDWMAEEVASGRLGAHAAANFLVPLTRVNGEDGRRLAERIRGLGLSNRQLGELYACYRASSGAVRRRIVDDPALFLKARSAAKDARAEDGLDEKQQRCVKNLELIGNVSLGLARSLPEALNYDTPGAARRRLGEVWRASRERFELLAKSVVGLLREEGGDAGQADADGDIDVGGQGPQAARDRAGAWGQPQQRQAGAAGANDRG
jgi:ParB/RepB/Spo0J family partition protein